MVKEKQQYLKKYLILDKEIEAMCEELWRWRSEAVRVSPTTKEVLEGKPQSLTLETTIESIEEVEKEIYNGVKEKVQLRSEIMDCIDTVEDDRLRLILRYRYVNGATLEKIADEMNYSSRQIERLHNKALDEIKMS